MAPLNTNAAIASIGSGSGNIFEISYPVRNARNHSAYRSMGGDYPNLCFDRRMNWEEKTDNSFPISLNRTLDRTQSPSNLMNEQELQIPWNSPSN